MTDVVEWYSLGINLGLSKDELDIIRHDFHGQGVQQYRLEAIALWYNKYPHVKWSDLFKALVKTNRARLAHKLALKYRESHVLSRTFKL